MALNKQPLTINFSQGLDTKTDPFQVAPGRFLALENMVFTKAGLLSKRNGFGLLPSLPDSNSIYTTTFKDNLLALGDALYAFSEGSEEWVDQGPIHPLKLSVLPVMRSNTSQTQADTVVASNGIAITVFTDNVPSGGSTSAVYKYVIYDSTTGQNIVAPTSIPVPSGSITNAPRVFLLGRYFIIVATVLISATNHLQAIAISINDPTMVVTTIDVSNTYSPASTLAFDGIVANNSLYLAWNGSDLGGAIRATFIDSTLTQNTTVSTAAVTGTHFSLAADISSGNTNIYVSFYDSGTTDGYSWVLDSQLNEITAPTKTISSLSVTNIASTAADGTMTLFYERSNNYTYDSTIATHYIAKRTMELDGTLGTAANVVRSVGLASKAFLFNDVSYFLAIYNSTYQPTYFLINEAGEVVSKLAYSNAASYYVTGLPSAIVSGDSVKIPYLFKDLIQAVNKTQGVSNATGVYSQTGINLATFQFDISSIVSSEIGGSLHLSGGFLWQYDGLKPVEHGFHLWPDYVEATTSTTGGAMSAQQYYYIATYEWTDSQGNIHRSAPSLPVSADLSSASPTPITFTSVFSSGATSITVSSATGLKVGQVLTDSTTGANIQAGTYITSINGTTVGLSLPTAGNSAGSPGDTLRTVTINKVTVNVPTLRLTYKTETPVKIVLYRWSTAQQTYYQVTSVQIPTLNDTTADSVSFVDTQADTSIIGNNILYTTGGVLENIAAPATNVLSLFNNRIFLVDAEDENLLWYSKQVIENVPVEMSDLLTLYVAPTTGAKGSTGPVRVLAPLDDKLILFKPSAIYYMNGIGPDNTGANSQYSDPVFVTSTVGCDNPQSIVFMPNGLMFESDKGIWLLGRGLTTEYIGAPVEKYTEDATVLSAVNVPGTNQVRFTLDSGITLMYDYYYGQWGVFRGVPAISSVIYQDLHTYINSLGQVYQETPDAYLDGSAPVTIKFTTSWLNLAGLQGFERAYYFYLLGVYLSPHKLSVKIAYDYNPSPTQVSVITPDNYSPNWGADPTWGGSTPWGGPNNLEQWRVFFQTQKCQAFQITLEESFDPSYGTVAGAGLTLSGLTAMLGLKSSYPRLKATRSVG